MRTLSIVGIAIFTMWVGGSGAEEPLDSATSRVASSNGHCLAWLSVDDQKWNGDGTFIGDCPGGVLVHEIGFGRVTGQGPTTWNSILCMNLTTFVGAGTGTLAGPAGSLNVTYDDLVLTFTSPITANWTETDHLIDGTGKFADATSGIIFSGGTLTFTSPTHYVWDGIAKDPRNKICF